MKEFIAWAIDTQSTEGHSLLGRYFFSNYVTPSLEGCQVALFTTRAIARQCLKEKFKSYTLSTWRPKVIKVKVIVEKA